MDIELKQFRQFVTLAETLHFGAASVRLGIEQPALSQSIRRLEDYLGVKLFNRSSRHVSLTPAGAAFFEDAIALLNEADRAVKRIKSRNAEEPEFLKIGLLGNTLFGPLTSIIASFRKKYPNTVVSIEECPIFEQISRLRDNTLDLAVLRTPHIADCHDLEFVNIEPLEELVAAVPSNHILARKEKLSLLDLAGEPLILYPGEPSPDFVAFLMKAFRQQKLEPKVVAEGNTLFVILALIAYGLGSSIITSPDMRQIPHGVTCIPLLDVRAPKETRHSVGWLRNRSSPALKHFAELARKHGAV